MLSLPVDACKCVCVHMCLYAHGRIYLAMQVTSLSICLFVHTVFIFRHLRVCACLHVHPRTIRGRHTLSRGPGKQDFCVGIGL